MERAAIELRVVLDQDSRAMETGWAYGWRWKQIELSGGALWGLDDCGTLRRGGEGCDDAGAW